LKFEAELAYFEVNLNSINTEYNENQKVKQFNQIGISFKIE